MAVNGVRFENSKNVDEVALDKVQAGCLLGDTVNDSAVNRQAESSVTEGERAIDGDDEQARRLDMSQLRVQLQKCHSPNGRRSPTSPMKLYLNAMSNSSR